MRKKTMGKFKKKKKRTNMIVLIVTLVFAVAGITFLAIGFGDEALVWCKTFGLTILGLLSPLIVYLVFQFINRKVDDM